MKFARAPLVGALLISACATTPTEPFNSPESQQRWRERSARLEQLSTWHFDGRAALQSGDEGWNATLAWSQFGEVYEIDLRGPFGAGAISILGSPAGVAVRGGDDPPVLGADASDLLLQHIGWPLPVESLEYWLVGRPNPNLASEMDVDASGHIVRLLQSGWTVEFKTYDSSAAEYALPRKIFARNQALALRLVIDRWILN